MQKMIHDKNTLTSTLREQEVDLIEKRSVYGQHEADVLRLRSVLSDLRSSIQALEAKVQTDKRVKYDLEKVKKDEKKQMSVLEDKETVCMSLALQVLKKLYS